MSAIATQQRRGDSFAEAAEMQRVAKEALAIDEHDAKLAAGEIQESKPH